MLVEVILPIAILGAVTCDAPIQDTGQPSAILRRAVITCSGSRSPIQPRIILDHGCRCDFGLITVNVKFLSWKVDGLIRRDCLIGW